MNIETLIQWQVAITQLRKNGCWYLADVMEKILKESI
jgi:hypothetical protein